MSKVQALSILTPGDPTIELWLALTSGLHGIWSVAHDIRPRWEFTAAETQHLEFHRATALMSFYMLHVDAASKGIKRYNLIPKYYQVDEMCRRAIRTSVSHALSWCFRAEDQMGALAKIMYKVHGSTSSKRTIQRWLIQFWS